jgi:hypothetical protein
LCQIHTDNFSGEHATKYNLTPWVWPAALVMQRLVDVGRMGSSSLAAHSADIHQSNDTQGVKL